MERSEIEEICRKIRACAKEFGEEKISNAVIIGNSLGTDHVSNLQYIYAPTIPGWTLGMVEFKVARFFEDC